MEIDMKGNSKMGSTVVKVKLKFKQRSPPKDAY